MQLIHNFTFYIHISFGICALLVFWVPVFARKGSLDHKRFGRFFAIAMYALAFSGLVMSGIDLASPLSGHPQAADASAERLAAMAANIRLFAYFLFSLSILVLATTRQGWLVILNREDRSVLRTPLHIGLCAALIVAGVVLSGVGFYTGEFLFMIFGALEVWVGINQLRYAFKEKLGPKEWWVEHLGGLTASGIAAYTAFFVFGGNQLISQIFSGSMASVQIFLWVAPGVIGGVAIAVLSRQYTRRFASMRAQ